MIDGLGAPAGHALFDTPIGPCGIAWGPGGIVAVQLPEQVVAHGASVRGADHHTPDAQATRERMLRELGRPDCAHAALPPPVVRHAIEGIQALMAGAPRDLREVPLDMSRISAFHQQVYAITRAIAPGHTRTYGDVAQELGGKGLARAVGQALGLNPFAPVVPCHRVLAAGGKTGGFSAGGGATTKLRMLAMEGACVGGTLPLFEVF